MPSTWKIALVDAAFCCDDLTVHRLVAQLPTELADLATTLTQLTDNFEFEEILQLLPADVPT
jgi:hypothetical protein